MPINAPVILLPTPNNYSTDIVIQTLSGTTDPGSARIQINGSIYGVSYTAGETVWSWAGSLVSGVNIYNVVAYDNSDNPAQLRQYRLP